MRLDCMSKITESARGQTCKVRIPMVCNGNNETVVSAHLSGIRFGHGIGKKVLDIHAADCCSSCHDAIDGRSAYANLGYTKRDLQLLHLQGVIETQLRLIDEGLL
jgi:hypothetical protein